MSKRKKNGHRKNRPSVHRELEYKEDGQEYAQVLRMLGNSRCEVQCMDGIKRLAHIRGKMKNTIWINMSDYVLVGLREFQDGKCDIIQKYTDEEVRTLKSYGELPEQATLTPICDQDDCTFDFDDI